MPAESKQAGVVDQFRRCPADHFDPQRVSSKRQPMAARLSRCQAQQDNTAKTSQMLAPAMLHGGLREPEEQLQRTFLDFTMYIVAASLSLVESPVRLMQCGPALYLRTRQG